MALTGDPIKQEVFQQLQRREEVYSQQNGNSTLGFRSNNDLFYLNSSNAWIRLISGADVLNPNTNRFDSQVAQQFVLWGGEATYSKFPIPNWKKEEGINFTDSSLGNRKTYNFDEQLGVRPQAGITSFSIKSKNRFGSIRQANIGFKVWTKSDLELAQTLFLKPGIPVILEWGRTPYLDNDGNLSNYDFKNSDLITFFNKVNFERILDLLENQREQHSYNYDGFLGLVSNFSFNLTSDGAFDCTLTVVSQGTVLESLTTQAPSTYLP